MADAKWQPAGAPKQGEKVTTQAVSKAVTKIKARNQEDKAARRQARRSGS